MPSIISGAAARQLYGNLTAFGLEIDSWYGAGRHEGIVVVARKCEKSVKMENSSFQRRTNVKSQLTGGVVITAHMPPSNLIKAKEFTTRLRPGWTEKQFINRVHLVMDQALIEISRMHWLNGLAALVKPFQDVPEFVEAVAAEEKRLGKVSDYASMTLEEVMQWMAWTTKWQQNHRVAS